MAPFEPIEVKVMDTSFVDLKMLKKHESCLFNRSFYDKKDKKVGIIMPSADSFFQVQKDEGCKKVSTKNKVGLDGYFDLHLRESTHREFMIS